MMKKRGIIIMVIGMFLMSTIGAMAAEMPLVASGFGTGTLKSSDFIELWECKEDVNLVTIARSGKIPQKALGTLDLYSSTACPSGFSPVRSLGYLFRYKTATTATANKLQSQAWQDQGLSQLDICEKAGDQGRIIIWDTKATDRTGFSCSRYGAGYTQKQAGYLYTAQPNQQQTPNSAETILFCKSHNAQTTSGATTFEQNYDLGACKAGGIGPEQGYLFKSNPSPIKLTSSDFVELKECTQANPNDATDVRKTLGNSLLYPESSCPTGYTPSRSLGYIFASSVLRLSPDSKYEKIAPLFICNYNGQGRQITHDRTCAATAAGDKITGGGTPNNNFLGYVHPANAYPNMPGMANLNDLNNPKTSMLCQELNAGVAALGKFPFSFYLGEACKTNKALQTGGQELPGGQPGDELKWWKELYVFETNPLRVTTAGVIGSRPTQMASAAGIPIGTRTSTPSATPETPAQQQPVSCVDNLYKAKLPVPAVWPPEPDVDSLTTADALQSRIKESEAKIQDILCRNKCFREQLGDSWRGTNCMESQGSGGSLPTGGFWMRVTGRIVSLVR